MARKYVDCRGSESVMNCTIAISANTEEELIEAAVQHAVAIHQHEDTAELRDEARASIQDGAPTGTPV